MANFIGVVFATLKKEGIDTKNMTTEEAIAKFNEIKGKDGGSNEKGEEQPKQEPKTAEAGKETAETEEKKKEPKTESGMSKENQAKADYLKDKINNSWYKNAKIDYGVEGQVKDISVDGDKMTITVEENGKTMTSTINYIGDYTPEQLYNIWQEFPEDDNGEDETASKMTNAMGIKPDEAKAFASGKGHLSQDGGYNGVSNVKDAPTFEYKSAEKYSGDKARFNNLYSGLEKGWGERAISEELSNIGFNESSIANFNSIRKTLKLDSEKSIEMLATMFNISHNRK